MRSAQLVFFAMLISGLCACKEEPEQRPIIGIKDYGQEIPIPDLFHEWRSTGINTLFVSPELAATPGFMDQAHQYDMPVYLIVPTFYNPEALGADSTLHAIRANGEPARQDWVHFICPNRDDYRQNHLAYLKSLVDSLSPQGISIDFIRYFVYWEQVGPDISPGELPQTCFCPVCLEKFRNNFDIILPDSLVGVEEKAGWILQNHEAEWTGFKSGTIAGYVREITTTLKKKDPTLIFNLHVLPWTPEDHGGAIRKVAGQDLELLGPLVDYVSPMCYSHMLKREPEWIAELVSTISELVTCPVLPSIQVSRAYLEKPFPMEDFEGALRAALREPSAGVIFWNWDALEAAPEKRQVAREILKE